MKTQKIKTETIEDYQKAQAVMFGKLLNVAVLDPSTGHWIINRGKGIVESQTKEGCESLSTADVDNFIQNQLKEDIKKYDKTQKLRTNVEKVEGVSE